LTVRATWILLLGACLLLPPPHARGGEPETLPVLRRKLLEANTPERVATALDALAARIGTQGFFADHGAFGDWLGEIPDGRDKHPQVLLRRGWAYVHARRGADAVAPLEAALADDPSNGLTRYYLGDALRQAGRYAEAADMLAAAARCGFSGPQLGESVLSALAGIQKKEPARDAKGLPSYVAAAAPYVLVTGDARVHLTLARWLLEDLKAFGNPGSERSRQWALAAGEHALAALTGLPERFDGDAALAFEAALTLDALDRERSGATPRTDLLALAVRLGETPGRDDHLLPRAITLLAEACASEGRYELAHRLALRRLAISDAPRARAVLRSLPPDIGAED